MTNYTACFLHGHQAAFMPNSLSRKSELSLLLRSSNLSPSNILSQKLLTGAFLIWVHQPFSPHSVLAQRVEVGGGDGR